MLYTEFILKAKDLTIEQHDNGLWYLNPEWHDAICRNITSDLSALTDSYLTEWFEVEDVLKLEVEKRNTMSDNKRYVIDWIFETIATVVQPAIANEQTDLIKAATEFIKTNHENDKQ